MPQRANMNLSGDKSILRINFKRKCDVCCDLFLHYWNGSADCAQKGCVNSLAWVRNLVLLWSFIKEEGG